MKDFLGHKLLTWLESFGIIPHFAILLQSIIVFIILVLLAIISDFIARKIILSLIAKMVKKTKTEWDDILLKRNVFNKISHFAPAIIIYMSAGLINHQGLSNFVIGASHIYMIMLLIVLLDNFLSSIIDIYQSMPMSKNRPIKGFVQVIKIFFYAMGTISIIALLFDKNPLSIIAGMGAFAAVLILVFKDTILGFVASVQLSVNQMVNVGDWISMPTKNTDGTVIDISLNTVKIQNWDKTISTIPTYCLISESFSNWKGMEDSDGRRIKRHICIDMKSVHFLTDNEISEFGKIDLISDYIKNKKDEIAKYNLNGKSSLNQRRLTNVGTFRIYLEEFLKHNKNINTEMTFLVRQLQASEKGLPIEIYVFSKDKEWANYEAIQSDIFDHILAVLPEMGLSVFQNPTGDDFQKILN